MTEYRRFQQPGATWFFTVNLAERKNNHLLVERIDLLKSVITAVKHRHPFKIDAMVVLPDHLHSIWTLPEGDSDFSSRRGLIKASFSRQIPQHERVSQSRQKRGERGLLQRRFWEHRIRDETDYRQHVDYIHWNPVKHGWVSRVKDWPYSSFHRHVNEGIYDANWGGDDDLSSLAMDE